MSQSRNHPIPPIIPERGFTLLELLVALVIISVLTATALPEYRRFRQQAFDNRALTDLRTVALGEEAYFLENEKYFSCRNETCATLPGVNRISEGTDVAVEGFNEGWTGEAKHPRGTGRVWRWDSSRGGLEFDRD
jgi:prepilin-type N-terminal cleavage/methylation domain-containing protein